MSKPTYEPKSKSAESFNNPATHNDKENTPTNSTDPPRFVAPTHGGVDILKLLSDLEDLVERARRIPLGFLRLDEDKFQMTIMKIRANLPEELKRASKLMRESERLVEETQAEADKLVKTAKMSADAELARLQNEKARQVQSVQTEAETIRAEAQREAERRITEADAQVQAIVMDSEVVRRAQIEAEETRKRAEAEAQQTMRGADQYAQGVLTQLENELTRVLGSVQRGIQHLN